MDEEAERIMRNFDERQKRRVVEDEASNRRAGRKVMEP